MITSMRLGAVVSISVAGLQGFQAFASSLGMANQKATQLQATMNRIRALTKGGLVMAGMGAGVVLGMLKAADAAGDLALALKSVQIAGNYTNEQMAQLQETTFRVSGMTARSAKDVAGWMRIVATSSNFTAQQLNAIMPAVARFADVMYFTKGTPFEQSVMLGARFSHLFQLYSPAALEKGFNKLAAASRVVPGGPQELMSSLTYSAPVAQVLGVSMDQQIALAALLNRLGLGSRAGTGMQNLLMYGMPQSAMLTGSRSNKQLQALGALGMITRGPHGAPMPIGMETGAFNAVEYFQGLARSFAKFTHDSLGHALQGPALAEARAQWMALVHNAFNIRGARVADIIGALPQSLQQLDEILKRFQHDMSVAEAQSKLLETWNVQLMRLKTNLANVFLQIMLPTVQGSGPSYLKAIGDALDKIRESITPQVASTILKVAAAFAIVTGAVGAMMLLNAALAAFALLGGPIALLAVAIGALAAVFINWQSIWIALKDFTAQFHLRLSELVEGIRVRFHGLVSVVQDFLVRIGAIARPQGPAPAAPGWSAVYDVSGQLAGYRRTQHGMGVGPIVSPANAAAAGATHIGAININVTGAPGQSVDGLADLIFKRLDERMRDAARGSGAGILHPHIPQHGY